MNASEGGENTPGGTNSRTAGVSPRRTAGKPGGPRVSTPVPTAEELRARFSGPSGPTVGLEEEIMLLDADTLDLAPRAQELLDRLGSTAPVVPELVTTQVETVTPPAATVPEALETLAASRCALGAAADALGGVRLACAGAHPFAAAEGELRTGPRYDAIAAEYGLIARRQVVFALQVHVAIRPADRALAVYNALRARLPELAALSANAPFHEGRDTGLASIRPTVGGQLPRQGVAPHLASFEAYAEALRWVGDPGAWWWELRPHPTHGTLELRVPDAQTTIADAGAVAAVGHCLAVWLAERHDAGESLPVPETWRIAENRWSALRHGLAGTMADLDTGRREPTSERVGRMLDDLVPVAARLRCSVQLEHAHALLAAGGPAAMARAAAQGDVRAATETLAARFQEGIAG